MLQLVVNCTHDVAGHRLATLWVHYTSNCNTQSSAPEDGQNKVTEGSPFLGAFPFGRIPKTTKDVSVIYLFKVAFPVNYTSEFL